MLSQPPPFLCVYLPPPPTHSANSTQHQANIAKSEENGVKGGPMKRRSTIRFEQQAQQSSPPSKSGSSNRLTYHTTFDNAGSSVASKELSIEPARDRAHKSVSVSSPEDSQQQTDSELVAHLRALIRALRDEEEEGRVTSSGGLLVRSYGGDAEKGVVIARRKRTCGDDGTAADNQNLDHQAKEHDVDFAALRELRASFSFEDPDTRVQGMPEEMFANTFGRVLCGFVDDEVLRAWCRSIDSRCSGFVTWKDLTDYLVRCASTGKWTSRLCSGNSGYDDGDSDIAHRSTGGGGLARSSSFRGSFRGGSSLRSGGSFRSSSSSGGSFSDSVALFLSQQQNNNNGAETETAVDDALSDRLVEGRPFHSKGHSDAITRILALPQVGSVLTASLDGGVRRWSHATLEGDERPLHVGNEWVTGLVKVSGVHRIAILHADRSVFFYNVSPNTSVTAATTTGSASPRPSSSPSTTAAAIASGGRPGQVKRSAAACPVIVEYYRGFSQPSVFVMPSPSTGQMLLHPTASKRTCPGEPSHRAAKPVTLFAPRKAASTALAHLASTPVSETVIIGSSDGHAEMFSLRIGLEADAVIPPTFDLGLHRGSVSQVTYAPELQCVLTSGLSDGKVLVTNLEHLTSTQVLMAEVEHRHSKPIAQFDYQASFHHALVHGYGRKILVWNALTGARNQTISDLDGVALQVALNPGKHHLYALLERKVLRVYDVRMWRHVETHYDDVNRLPVNAFEALVWNEATSMVMTGACSIVGRRTMDAQRALEDAATATVASSTTSGAPLRRTASSLEPPKPRAHDQPILHAHFLERAGQLVTVDSGGAKLWSTRTNRLLTVFRWAHAPTSAILCSAVSASGRKLLIGGDDGVVRWVSIANGREVVQLVPGVGRGVVSSATNVRTGGGAAHVQQPSACWVEEVSSEPGLSVIIVSSGTTLFSWLYRLEAPIPPASRKCIAAWRTLELQKSDGIIHCFASTTAAVSVVSGVVVAATTTGGRPTSSPSSTSGGGLSSGGGCVVLAATNSGRLVGFNIHMVLLFTYAPPEQIAAIGLLAFTPQLVLACYSNGDGKVFSTAATTDGGGVGPVRALSTQPSHYVTACTARMVSAESALMFAGDTSGHVSVFAVELSATVAQSRQGGVLMELIHCWQAHDSPISALVILPEDSSTTSITLPAVYDSTHRPQEHLFRDSAAASSLSSSPCYLITGSGGGELMRWEVSWDFVSGAASTTDDERQCRSPPIAAAAGGGAHRHPAPRTSLSSPALRRVQTAITFACDTVESDDDDGASTPSDDENQLGQRLRRRAEQQNSKASEQSKADAPADRNQPGESALSSLLMHPISVQRVAFSNHMGVRRHQSRLDLHSGDVARNAVHVHQALQPRGESAGSSNAPTTPHDGGGSSAPKSSPYSVAPSTPSRGTRPAMQRKFASFSNLLEASDRAALFDATAIVDANGRRRSSTTLNALVMNPREPDDDDDDESDGKDKRGGCVAMEGTAHSGDAPGASSANAGRPVLVRRTGSSQSFSLQSSPPSPPTSPPAATAFFGSEAHQQPLQKRPSPSNLSPSSPDRRSGSRYRTTNTSLTALPEGVTFVDELKRPISRTGVLCRLSSVEPTHRVTTTVSVEGGERDTPASGAGVESVEKRLEKLHRWRAEQDESHIDSGGGGGGRQHQTVGYFRRLELQTFGRAED